MKKALIILSLGLIGSIGLTQAVQVDFQPLYAEPRFAPANVYHAQCLSTLEITLADVQTQTQALHIELGYNSDQIDIIRLMPTIANKDTFAYEIQDSVITIDISETQDLGQTKDTLFQVVFQSKTNTTGSQMKFLPGSYVVAQDGTKIQFFKTFPLVFSQVPECNPDIIPPTITLTTPISMDTRIPLDTYFTFAFKDEGKGINKNSLEIIFDGTIYTGSEENIVWNGNSVEFYPSDWLPVNDKVLVGVKIKDKQTYGGSNVATKTFSFLTATGLVLEQNINPGELRMIAKKYKTLRGSDGECRFLEDVYHRTDGYYDGLVVSMLRKLGCDVPTQKNPPQVDHQEAQVTLQKQQTKKVSVFAALGWILFVLSFALKLHYMHSAKAHKRKLHGTAKKV